MAFIQLLTCCSRGTQNLFASYFFPLCFYNSAKDDFPLPRMQSSMQGLHKRGSYGRWWAFPRESNSCLAIPFLCLGGTELTWAKGSAEWGAGRVRAVSTAPQKGLMMSSLGEKSGNSQCWYLCLRTFDYSSARKKKACLTAPYVFCIWCLWYAKYAELYVMRVVTTHTTWGCGLFSHLWSALLRSVIPQVRSTTNKLWGLLNLSYTEFFSFFYATVSFFTPCSSAASEQAQGIAFLARHHGSDVIWDGISADTCTSDCPTAACQVRVHHMPGKSHLISVLEMLSRSQSFCYNFWLKTEFSWSERTFQVPEQAYLENVLISPCSTTACHRKELKILVLQHLAAQLPL